MKKLFIPHVPNRKIINRVYEFSQTSNSYFLNWNISNDSFIDKIGSQLKSLFQIISKDKDIITIPILVKPDYLALKFNTLILNYVIRKYAIKLVVNANALLFDIENICVPVVYDLVDDHLSVNLDIGLTDTRIEKIKSDINASIGVVCVTKALEEKVKRLNSNSIVIENGLYIERFKKAKSLKKELNFDGKKVFGYIGGVDEWTGIDKACKNFMKIKDNNNAMLVVGDSNKEFFIKLKEKYKNDILFVGLVSPLEVGNYFQTLDIGLIPFKLNNFTNNAYPIKAIEYALSGATVISTELKVLQEKKFPFIKFSNIDKFSDAMQKHKKVDFKFDFSDLTWARQTNRLIDFIEGCNV